MKKPSIGITLDYRKEGDFSCYPWYAVTERYIKAVYLAGGIPVLLAPYPEEDLIKSYFSLIQGLIVTGGNYDIDPVFYGCENLYPGNKIDATRTRFEQMMIQEAMANDLPFLGICGGFQLLNVVLGGTLIQHIPDVIEQALVHESNLAHPQGAPREKPSHPVKISENTLLHRIVETDQLEVNSAHHQALQNLGKNVVVNAVAPDGVIEGIEVQGLKFCLGVEWHPEFYVNEGDVKLFKHFIQVCS
jgi:putative glutamine amidotransferase